uniref:Uncharacterized protein n=1 Tax=Neospora caninum (strain Liverpool) TaxID=572307 RepID=F0JB98_NEOCL|nr:hypothetical protein, conserved [Neospora caninum Liverpool]CEL71365.1 TPA: hypothetical protein, conserved [Neospora caninum Liverpool]
MRQARVAVKERNAQSQGARDEAAAKAATETGDAGKEESKEEGKAEEEKAVDGEKENHASPTPDDAAEGVDAEEMQENEELSRERAMQVPELPARLPADGIVLFGPIQNSLLAPEELLVNLLSSREAAKISSFEIMTGEDPEGPPHPYPQLLTTLRTRRRDPEKGKRGAEGTKRKREATGGNSAGALEKTEDEETKEADGATSGEKASTKEDGAQAKEEMGEETGAGHAEKREETAAKEEEGASVKREKETEEDRASDEDSKGHESKDATGQDTPVAKKRRLESKLEVPNAPDDDCEAVTVEASGAETQLEMGAENAGEWATEEQRAPVAEGPNVDELSLAELYATGQGVYTQKQIAYRLIQYRDEDPLRLHYIVKVQCADPATFEWLLSHQFGRMRQQIVQGYPSSFYRLLYLRGKRRDKELLARAEETAQAEVAARLRNRGVAPGKRGFRGAAARPGAPGPFMGPRPGAAPPPPLPGVPAMSSLLPRPPPAPFGSPAAPAFPAAPPFLPPPPVGMAPRAVPCAPGASPPPLYPPGAVAPRFCPPPPGGAPPAPVFSDGVRREGPGGPGPFPGRPFEPWSSPPGGEPPRMYDPEVGARPAGEMSGFAGYEGRDRGFYGRETMKSPQYPRGPGGEVGANRRGPPGPWGPGGPEGGRDGFYGQGSPTERGPYMRRGPGPAGPFPGPEAMRDAHPYGDRVPSRDSSMTRQAFGDDKRPFGLARGGGFGFEASRGERGRMGPTGEEAFGSGAPSFSETGRDPFDRPGRQPGLDEFGRCREDFDRGYGSQGRAGGMYGSNNAGGDGRGFGHEGPGFRGRGFGFPDEPPSSVGDRQGEPVRARGLSSERFGGRRGAMWGDGSREQDGVRRYREPGFREGPRDGPDGGFSGFQNNFGYGANKPTDGYAASGMSERGGNFRGRNMESSSGAGGRGSGAYGSSYTSEGRGTRQMSGWDSYDDRGADSGFGGRFTGDGNGFDRFGGPTENGERGSRFGHGNKSEGEPGGFGRRQGRPANRGDFRWQHSGGYGPDFADGREDGTPRRPSPLGPPQWTIQKGPQSGGSSSAFGTSGPGQAGNAAMGDKFRADSAPPGIGPERSDSEEGQGSFSPPAAVSLQAFGGVGAAGAGADQNAFAEFAKQLTVAQEDGQGGQANAVAAAMAQMASGSGSQQALQQQLVALLSQQQAYGNARLQGGDMQQLMLYAQYYGCLLNGMSEQQATAVVQTQQLLQQQQQQLMNQQLLQQSIQQQQQLQLSLAGLVQSDASKPGKKK